MTASEGKTPIGQDSVGRGLGGEARPSGLWIAPPRQSHHNVTALSLAPGRWRVLLLVHDSALGDWLLEELRLANAAVALATKGREALGLARSGLVDVIISEMGLPDLPGLDLLRELRSMAEMPKVVLTTSRHSDFLANRAIEQGASAVLSKPFEIDELFRLLTHLLAN